MFMNKMKIGFFPTPLHEMVNLGDYFKKGKLYIKRDDLTGFGGGGNKIRKLEYILQDAVDKGYHVVCTFGGVQTNHGRLVASLCAKLNLKSVIICDGKHPAKMSGNLVLDKLFGADLYFMDSTSTGNFPIDEAKTVKLKLADFTINKVKEKYQALGEKVYFMPMGGHMPVGLLGYFDAALEINEQIKEQKLSIDYVVCAVGTGGTYAGLLLGAKFCNAPFKILGINVFYKSEADVNELVQMANMTSQMYQLGVHVSADDFHFSNSFLGKGYNIPDVETRRHIYLLSSKEGIVVDPCYTGKAFMGYCTYLEDGTIVKDSNSMFIHTGGFPGIYSQEHLDCIEEEMWDSNYQEYSNVDITSN